MYTLWSRSLRSISNSSFIRQAIRPLNGKMGGGNLNLKKSWHPSTVKNIEKVRKAEEQTDRENKRITELTKEIEIEKDREDIRKYAMKQSVIGMKENKKLDWMYKRPNQMVNREEYLLGRPIDKTFEQTQQAEKEVELNKMPKNHVEYECIPPSLRFFSGNEQVDLARKMQEDPLYAIKKKEIETRNQLLKNPVKLKQLRELLEQKSHKNGKKKKRSKQDSSEDEAKLDILLATKYKQLKDNINEQNLLNSMKKMRYKQKRKSKKHSQNSENELDSSKDTVKEEQSKQRKKDNNDSDNDSNSNKSIQCKKRDNKKEYDKRYLRDDTEINDNKLQVKIKTSSKDRNLKYERSKTHWDEYNTNYKWQRHENNKQRHCLKYKYKNKERYSAEKRNDIPTSNSGRTSVVKSSFNINHMKFKNKEEIKYRLKTRSTLTEEEKEQRRQEMMANAKWRDKEREKNVRMYHEEKKTQNNESYNKDFIRKQLVVVTEVGTVASRIKANINNIQRFSRAMDTNFAKR